MPDYQKMYTCLYNAITDALSNVEQCKYSLAIEILIHAQQETEEIYISSRQEK